MSSTGDATATMVCFNPIWTDRNHARGSKTTVSEPRFLFMMVMVLAHQDREHKEQGKHDQCQNGHPFQVTDDVLVLGPVKGFVRGFRDFEYETLWIFAVTWFLGQAAPSWADYLSSSAMTTSRCESIM